MNKLRISTYTLGCKLNYTETATVLRSFEESGFEAVDFDEEADVVLINTCTVTENADRDARKTVRRALRRSPRAFVIVTGCFAQLRPEQLAAIRGVDLILGAEEKFNALDYIKNLNKHGAANVCVGELKAAARFGPAFAADHDQRTRAFLKVQDGCDYNCAFCTIPMARGAARSQSMPAAIEQAKAILDKGFREIVLSGVNVGDYGSGQGASLAELLAGLLEIPGDFRLRISSIEPNLLTDEIISLAAENDKLCSHFHVPLQSGSDEMLRRMRRRYAVDQYRERIESLVARIPDSGIGIDVITGFPGETGDLFEETFAFLDSLPFSYLHVFTYSERPDTHALTMDGVVPRKERSRRTSALRMLSEKKRSSFQRAQLGSARRVLFENGDPAGLIEGFTDNYIRVAVPYSAELRNTLRRIRLLRQTGGPVTGEICE